MEMMPVSDLTLMDMAQNQRKFAYAPYSNYRVGCVVYAPGGDHSFFFGSNIENSSYGLTMCAERIALFNWAKHPNRHPIHTLAFATDSDGHFSPCGACLQVMLEFMKPETIVIHHNGKTWHQYYFSNLIPYANSSIVDKVGK
jgi:cytidine deaminase